MAGVIAGLSRHRHTQPFRMFIITMAAIAASIHKTRPFKVCKKLPYLSWRKKDSIITILSGKGKKAVSLQDCQAREGGARQI